MATGGRLTPHPWTLRRVRTLLVILSRPNSRLEALLGACNARWRIMSCDEGHARFPPGTRTTAMVGGSLQRARRYRVSLRSLRRVRLARRGERRIKDDNNVGVGLACGKQRSRAVARVAEGATRLCRVYAQTRCLELPGPKRWWWLPRRVHEEHQRSGGALPD